MLARGAVVYAGNCVACHGVAGNGEGIDAPQRLLRPANFTAI
ncbi:c-type cytochrome [Sulfuriferula sp.]